MPDCRVPGVGDTLAPADSVCVRDQVFCSPMLSKAKKAPFSPAVVPPPLPPRSPPPEWVRQLPSSSRQVAAASKTAVHTPRRRREQRRPPRRGVDCAAHAMAVPLSLALAVHSGIPGDDGERVLLSTSAAEMRRSPQSHDG